jgi:hypothetical protein
VLCPSVGDVGGVSQVLTDTTTVNAARRSRRVLARSFLKVRAPLSYKEAPSPGRQVSGMAGAWYPDDLPEGYHTSGYARSTGCHASPGAVWRSKSGADRMGAPVIRRDA